MHTGARARKQKYISIYISLYMKTFLKTGVYIYIYIYIYIYMDMVLTAKFPLEPFYRWIPFLGKCCSSTYKYFSDD